MVINQDEEFKDIAEARYVGPPADQPHPKLLYALEGFTDIRFIVGLSKISELTLLTPELHYHSRGLDKRLIASNCKVHPVIRLATLEHLVSGSSLGLHLDS